MAASTLTWAAKKIEETQGCIQGNTTAAKAADEGQGRGAARDQGGGRPQKEAAGDKARGECGRENVKQEECSVCPEGGRPVTQDCMRMDPQMKLYKKALDERRGGEGSHHLFHFQPYG